MRNLFLFAVLLTLLVVTATLEKCPWGKKRLNKKIKQYHKQCLKNGFESSLGCESEDGKLKKKALKRCGKLEGIVKKCGYECAIDGSWNDFGAWSECSAACGGGFQTRTRTCSNPAPAYGGADCNGQSKQEQACNVQACKPYSLKMACDDYLTVYVDGVKRYADRTWTVVGKLSVPATTRVVAVSCYNLGGPNGIIGEMRDGDGNQVMVTDASWRCSNVAESGWEKPNFVERCNWRAPLDLGSGHYMQRDSRYNQITATGKRVIW